MRKRNKFRYTDRQISFLAIFYRHMSVDHLTEMFNVVYGTQKSRTEIGSALQNHRIKCGRKHADRFIRRLRLYTDEQARFIRDNYKGRSVAELTVLFNDRFETRMREQQIKSFVHNRGIICGRTGQFEKGHLPWNAGTKGQGLTGRNRTTFLKGNVPGNTRPLGSERVDARDGRVQVKVEEPNPYTGAATRFKAKHVVIWEQTHGMVPKGMAVVFIEPDGPCKLENLILVSRAELLELNSRRCRYRDTHPNLRTSVLALAKLRVKTFAKQKERF